MEKAKAKTSSGRRLLSKVAMDWDEAWESFVSNVHSDDNNDNVCKIAGSLSNVQVDADGTYQFSCSSSPELCDCASSVGTGSTSADTQYFVNEDMGVYLGVFKDGGAAAYEICETGGECHAYGDVNDGMVARRRRRRLLQAGGGGGSYKIYFWWTKTIPNITAYFYIGFGTLKYSKIVCDALNIT